MKKFVCIDVGGTSIKYGLSNENGEFIHKDSMDTEALEKGGVGILEKMKTISRKYIENNDIEGICISTAGMVRSNRGKNNFCIRASNTRIYRYEYKKRNRKRI